MQFHRVGTRGLSKPRLLAAILVCGLWWASSSVAAQAASAGAKSVAASASGASRVGEPKPANAASAPLDASKPKQNPPSAEKGGLEVDPDLEIVFEKVKVGAASPPLRVTIKSNAAEFAGAMEVKATGDFSVDPLKCNVSVGGSCALSVVFKPLQPGETKGAIEVILPSGHTYVASKLTGLGAERCGARTFFGCSGFNGMAPVALLAGIYLLALILVRWNMIAVPSRRLLATEIEAVRGRIGHLKDGGLIPAASAAAVETMLSAAQSACPLGAWDAGISDVLGWSRGQETASWQLLHEVEEQLVAFEDAQQIRASLEGAVDLLRKAGTPPCTALADRIAKDLVPVPLQIRDVTAATLRELQDFATRLDTDTKAKLNAAVAVTPPPADCISLSAAVQMALVQATALTTSVGSTLTALISLAPQPPAEFSVLLQHADQVILPAAVGLRADLAAASAGPTTPAQWSALFARVARDFSAPADLYARRIQAALAAEPQYSVARLRALLSEAFGMIYDRRDTDFATLLGWHNKTMWLTSCGLLLIVALAATLENDVLFLLGATGGLLSRLSRSLYSQDVQTDYGASWTTLFLSPVVGAVTGWTGVLIVLLAVKLQILGPLFSTITWDNSFNALSFGMAVLFGFSERAFDTVLSQLETKVVGGAGTSSASSAPPSIVNTSPLAAGVVQQPYDLALQATGGKGTFTWAVTAGVLPAGIVIAAGHLRGAPTTAGSSTFTLEATDSTSAKVSKQFTITIT